MILGSQYNETSPCRTKSQLLALANMTRIFEEADGNEIYEMTGCLSPCEKDRYSVSVGSQKQVNTRTKYERCQLHFDFIMQESSYQLEEQYHIYDGVSFIADIGGYMGLLLGSSLLGIYLAMENFLRRLCCKSGRVRFVV